MNEEIDETEFYHQDFTTASDWEIFVSRIEEIINQWKIDELRDEPRNNNVWTTKSEKLIFVDTEFELFYFKKINGSGTRLSSSPTDAKDEENKIKKSADLDYDFQLFDLSVSHSHSNLFTWYGLEEYFVLAPTGNGITNESKIKVLLSSIYIVTSNLNCEIPIFVQIQEKWQNCYMGVHESEQFRVNFEMVHLKKGPQHCQHLTGLLSLFAAKIMSPTNLDHIISSVQFTYDLTDFGKSCWKQDIFSLDGEMLDITSLYNLPLGVTIDPISVLQLKATWFDIPSYKVNDSQAYSDFNASRAHQWSIIVKMCENPVCLLSDSLTEYLNLCNNTSTVYEVLGELNPLDALVESKVANIPSILGRAARNSLTGSSKDTNGIPDEILVPILYYLFPDAQMTEGSNPYDLGGGRTFVSNVNFDFEKECKGFKTCPRDSLLWRFAIVSASLLHSVGGYRAFAQLWYEFLQEMRYRWDKNITIPGLLKEPPDLRTCLLNQKLQMLNCCIEKKKLREELQKEPHFDSAENSSTDDEEFFDCADKPEDDTRKIQPSGRLGKFETLKLIETGEDLYIPITQEPVPKTEDQLDEDADALLKLGSDAQGSVLRAKLMSASLLSDMESFKAANPGAILEDFVRWYSPRDWKQIDDEEDQWGQKKGNLSTRMLIEGNIWAQMWQSARAVPANKQKLLFVDTREAEKVLHFLESRSLAQVCELLLPTLLQASIYRLADEVTQLDIELDSALGTLQNLIKLSERITRESKISVRRVEAIVQEMAQLELVISEVNSLYYKLNPSGNVPEDLRGSVRDLVRGKEVKIDKASDIGSRLSGLFADSHRNANFVKEEVVVNEEGKFSQGASVFMFPNEREFVMRVNAVKPALYSSRCPQYLRAILSKSEFRLAGAFAEDISFF